MKTHYKMQIAGVERDLPLCRLTDDLYIGAFVMFGDAEITVAAAKALLEKVPEYDYLITAEAKGIPLAYEMARQRGDEKYFVARKGPKLYMKDVFDVEVKSISTAKMQRLYLDKAEAEIMRGKRILIVDDVISTGESLHALEQLVAAVGGNVVASATVLAEGDAQKRKDIIYLEPLPLFDGNGDPLPA